MGGYPVALPVARGPAAGPRALQVVSGPLHARRAVSAAPAPAIPLKAGVSLGTCVSEGDDASLRHESQSRREETDGGSRSTWCMHVRAQHASRDGGHA